MTMRTAKVFMDGGSQVIRIPKDWRFDCDEVYVRKQGDGTFISAKPQTWDGFFNQESAFSDNYLTGREDIPPQTRDF